MSIEKTKKIQYIVLVIISERSILCFNCGKTVQNWLIRGIAEKEGLDIYLIFN